ncbi:MAG TPA: alcohol dehydrogenase catalytic domain-containing protein, partial [Acidimicrobiia bacterium]|nr:alcohol dehydrogenase catalytic domain-containing protein [Acidimicrobiia bacterium]
MKALVKAKPEPGLWMEEVEIPRPGSNDVLVRVKKTSICGTDLHIYRWDDWAQRTIPLPMVIGHEFTGEIVRKGDQVAGLEVGERVAGEGHITCGHCRNCRGGRRNFCHNHAAVGVTRPGAFAEYIAIPANNAFSVRPHIDEETAAVLDPLGNAIHTSLFFDVVGEDVLITGAGPIGL